MGTSQYFSLLSTSTSTKHHMTRGISCTSSRGNSVNNGTHSAHVGTKTRPYIYRLCFVAAGIHRAALPYQTAAISSQNTRDSDKHRTTDGCRVRRRWQLLERVNERPGCNYLQLLKSIIMEYNLPSLLFPVTQERSFSTVTDYEMNAWNSICTKDFHSISTKDFSYLYHATYK